MADGDHCHSIVIDGDHIIFNRPMYLSVYYEQHEDALVPGGLVLAFWDNPRHEEPNQPASPVSPLQQISASDELLPSAHPPVILAHSEEPEDFLLYDYYDTEYSDTEQYDSDDLDQGEFDLGIGGSESSNRQDSVDEEPEQGCVSGKRTREDDYEEEEQQRSRQRFRTDSESARGNFQIAAPEFPHNGAVPRVEESRGVEMESMVYIDPGGEEGQEDKTEKFLLKGSTIGRGGHDGADENQRALPLHS